MTGEQPDPLFFIVLGVFICLMEGKGRKPNSFFLLVLIFFSVEAIPYNYDKNHRESCQI